MTCPLQIRVHSSHMRLKFRMLEQVVENTGRYAQSLHLDTCEMGPFSWSQNMLRLYTAHATHVTAV